jgi:5'-nucleotidase (lipoprotein e(P4) family)
MRRNAYFSIAVLPLLLFGCAQPAPPPAASPTYDTLNAVLWMQTSVEYRADARQTYHAAEAALLRGLKDKHWTAAIEQSGDFSRLPPAVILDLDETVLDNSVFQARETASGEPYSSAKWSAWLNEAAAGLVPGAKDFLDFAVANKVTPIYITNRACDSTKDDDSTVQVLRKLGLPLDKPSERLYCADANHGDKTQRRQKCSTQFRVVLMFGDQLGDFLQIPADSANLAGREKLYEANEAKWGERWFQLPNPTYGSWLDALGSNLPDKLKHLRQ